MVEKATEDFNNFLEEKKNIRRLKEVGGVITVLKGGFSRSVLYRKIKFESFSNGKMLSYYCFKFS